MKPTAEQQLQFLQHLQRLFDEGDFVATYKYALLMSLAELAVESGVDEGELELPMIRCRREVCGVVLAADASLRVGRARRVGCNSHPEPGQASRGRQRAIDAPLQGCRNHCSGDASP